GSRIRQRPASEPDWTLPADPRVCPIAADGRREWQPGAQRQNAGDLPASEHAIDELVRAAEKMPARAEGQLVNRADYQILRRIVVAGSAVHKIKKGSRRTALIASMVDAFGVGIRGQHLES